MANINKTEKGFTVIPNKIKTDNTISLLSRFILADIISFTEKGSCYASNDWFSIQYNVSKRRVEQCIKELNEKEYIYTLYNVKSHKRFLSPTIKVFDEVTNEQEINEIEKEVETEKKYVVIKDLKKIWT